MENQIILVIMLLTFVTLIYFGYRDDFRRNKGLFIYIIFGITVTFIAFGIGSFVGSAIVLSATYRWKEDAVKKINEFFGSKS